MTDSLANRIRALHNLRNSLPFRALQWKGPPRAFRNPPQSDHTAIRVTGGIGDLIVSLPACEALQNIVGDVRVYSKWPEIAQMFAPTLYHEPEIKMYRRGLDWHIQLCGIADFRFANNFRGFRNWKMNSVFIENRRFISQNEWSHVVDCHPHLDCMMATKAVKMGHDRRSISFAFLGLPFKWPTPLDLPYAWRTLPKYITVHDGFDNMVDTGGKRATKTWDLSNWESFVKKFKKRTDGKVKIIQIGGKNSRPIEGADINLCGTMQFEQSVHWIAGSLCHIDGDSGLVHAAARVGTRCVTLFGPTDAKFFGYPENVNIASKYCSGCWWTTQEWMAQCPIGFSTPKCMDEISADEPLEAVMQTLGMVKYDRLTEKELE